jgi:c-di-GMP-binding flagellar brake protein YcgR
MEMDPRERRKHHRVNEELQAILVNEPHGNDMRGAKVRDISEGGACIVLDGPLPVGAETYVGFFLKDDSQPLVAVARVVWSRREGKGHLLGLQFAHGTAAQRTAIARLSEYLETRRMELVVTSS